VFGWPGQAGVLRLFCYDFLTFLQIANADTAREALNDTVEEKVGASPRVFQSDNKTGGS
jgi:hypothetical protein